MPFENGQVIGDAVAIAQDGDVVDGDTLRITLDAPAGGGGDIGPPAGGAMLLGLNNGGLKEFCACPALLVGGSTGLCEEVLAILVAIEFSTVLGKSELPCELTCARAYRILYAKTMLGRRV